MTEPWKVKFDKKSIHANIKDAIKALSGWFELPDAALGTYIVTVKIEKKKD